MSDYALLLQKDLENLNNNTQNLGIAVGITSHINKSSDFDYDLAADFSGQVEKFLKKKPSKKENPSKFDYLNKRTEIFDRMHELSEKFQDTYDVSYLNKYKKEVNTLIEQAVDKHVEKSYKVFCRYNSYINKDKTQSSNEKKTRIREAFFEMVQVKQNDDDAPLERLQNIRKILIDCMDTKNTPSSHMLDIAEVANSSGNRCVEPEADDVASHWASMMEF